MRRLVWFLWDAAAAVWAERFLAEGSLPNLARLAARGTRAGARPAWPCSQTPPGTATLVTGAPTHVHGVYGFREAARPRGQVSALETETGFDARKLRAEPMWTAAARAGRSVALGFAPLASPAEVYARGALWGPPAKGQGEILVLDGYGAALAGQTVATARTLVPAAPPPPPEGLGPLDDTRGFRLALPLFASLAGDETPRAAPDPSRGARPGEECFALLLGTGRLRGRERFDRAWVALERSGRPSVELPVSESGPVPILLSPTVGMTLLLFSIAPDGKDLLLWGSGVWRVRSSRAGAAESVVRAAGPFVGAGAGHSYRDGLLGETCREGGNGLAEERYLRSLAASSAAFARAGRYLLREVKADVTFLYEPCIDETAHIFEDLAEDAHARKTDGVASERGLAALREAYVLADKHLGEILSEIDDDATVAITSDHGQQAVRLLHRPNVALREAGLLAIDESGRIDLARTRVLYGTSGNGYLIVNSADRPHGIVPRGEIESAVRAAVDALVARRGPGGEPLVTGALFPGESCARGRVPGEEAGDAFLINAPGVALGSSPLGEVVEPASGGQHTAAVDSPDLDALFVVGGPTVPKLGRLEARVENADVAPTLASLVGLPPPAHATGRSLFS